MSGPAYVAGFLFWRDEVLLVEKTRPEWQFGLWNAIGGKIEDAEDAHSAMCREFHEETGFHVPTWNRLCGEHHADYTVYFYWAGAIDSKRPEFPESNDVGEKLIWVPVSSLSAPPNRLKIIGNLQWLIPLARDPRFCAVTVYPMRNIALQPTW